MVFETHQDTPDHIEAAIERAHELLVNQVGWDTESFEIVPTEHGFETRTGNFPIEEKWEYGDPCPECGNSDHFSETCATHGVTHFDGDGNVIDFDWEQFDYPLYVECPECNTVLLDRLPEDV